MGKIRTVSENTNAILDVKDDLSVIWGRLSDIMSNIYGYDSDAMFEKYMVGALTALGDAVDQMLLLSINNETAIRTSATV